MTDLPKRPRGRPRKPGAATASERKRASAQARQIGRVELPGTVLATLDALVQRHGDASRAACVTRLVQEAAD